MSACAGPKIVFLMFLKLKIFRLRRAKIRIFCFWNSNFRTCSGSKNHVLCVFRAKISPPAAGVQQSWFQKVFTNTGTRYCYSQNDLAAARARFLVFSRVQRRASTISKTIQEPYWCDSWSFHECKDGSRTVRMADVSIDARTSIHERRTHPHVPVVSLSLSGGVARRRRENFGDLLL